MMKLMYISLHTHNEIFLNKGGGGGGVIATGFYLLVTAERIYEGI